MCPESAGRSETRTESHVRIAAIKSSPECSASDSTPRLPVATAKNTFSATSTNAEPMDPSAAICLTDVGVRVMEENLEKDYTMQGRNVAQALCLCAFLSVKNIHKVIHRKNRTGRVPVLLKSKTPINHPAQTPAAHFRACRRCADIRN